MIYAYIYIYVLRDMIVIQDSTLFDVQGLAGVDLHLDLPVGLVFAEPAVAGEHVLLAMDRDLDLDTVQEPTSTQALVGVANEEPVYLPI